MTIATKYDIKKTINQIIREKGRFPTQQDMSNKLGYSFEQVNNYMRALSEDGYIEKINDWYRFPENQELTEPDIEEMNEILPAKRKRGRPKGTTKKVIEASQTAQEPRREVLNLKSYKFTAIGNVKIGMGLIGAGATIISIYYSTIWLIEFLPLIFAIILSAIMVGFAVLSFETAIIFNEKKGFKKYPIIVCFIFLWGIVSIFSIMSTVGGQYNKNVKNLQKYEEQAPGRVEWTGLQNKKNDIEQIIKDKREQISNFKSLQGSMNDLESRKKNSRVWGDTNWQIKVASKELSKALEEKENIRIEEKEILKKYPNILSGDGKLKKIPDFYSWVSEIFKTDRDKMQFFLSLIPAVFCDIICSIGIAVFLFLKEE